MFTLSSPFAPGGFGGGGGTGALMSLQTDLAKLKSAPILNPHYGMIQAYLHVLNGLVEPLALSQGPLMGVRSWLIEVQFFLKAIQKRVFSGMPLQPAERAAIQNFSSYWRQMGGPPYNMARPEAQLVLITLSEFVMH